MDKSETTNNEAARTNFSADAPRSLEINEDWSESTSTTATSSSECSRKRKMNKRSQKKNNKKRRRKEKGIDGLAKQVSEMQNYLQDFVDYTQQSLFAIQSNNQYDSNIQVDLEDMPSTSHMPSTSKGVVFDFGTHLKDPSVPPASSDHLNKLQSLQHFDSENWKDVRYFDTQKAYNAKPGFTDLEVNNELKMFENPKSLVTTSDKCYAAITHALIMQGEAFQQGFTKLMEWATETGVVNSSDLLNKINDIFSGDFQKISNDCLQLVCGRRADILNQRREYFLNFVKEKHMRETLRKIPPTKEFLFEKVEFSQLVKDSGGMSKVFDVQERKRVPGSQTSTQARPSSNTQAGGRYPAPSSFIPRTAPLQSNRNYYHHTNSGNVAVPDGRFFRPSFRAGLAGQRFHQSQNSKRNQSSSQTGNVNARQKGGNHFRSNKRY